MIMTQHFVLRDECELWLQDIMNDHYEEALAKANSILARTVEDQNGCWTTTTQRRPKVRFRGRQVAVARFVYCVANRSVIGADTVIRHRCHNELCCNPAHLIEGSAADNKRDDWDYWANGVDYQLL